MPPPSNSEPQGCLKLFIDTVGNIGMELINTVYSFFLFGVIFYILLPILIWAIADKSENITLLCVFGILCMAFWMFIFSKAIKKSEKLLNRKVEIENRLKRATSKFDRTWSQIELFIVNHGGQKTFKLAAVAIVSSHVFTKFLIEIGSGEFVTYFDSKNWNIVFVGFMILPFAFGIYSDINSRYRNEILNPSLSTRILYFLGVFEFFRNIIIYFTGVFGGKNAFFAVKAIDDLVPTESLDIIATDWYVINSYEHTNSFIIYKELGFYLFFMIYIFVPFGVILMKKRMEKINSPSFPMSIVNPAYQVSLLILIIPIYVGWKEEWFSKAFEYFKNILS